MIILKFWSVFFCCILSGISSFSQRIIHSDCPQPATIILFRPFDFFNFKFSYNLFSGDSLLGRITTHDVIILETFDHGVSFHATTKAPSLNATKRTKYLKQKTIHYPFSIQPGQVYFVQCGFLKQDLFQYPRQPTIRLIKEYEQKKYLRKRFLKREIKKHLYGKWLTQVNERK